MEGSVIPDDDRMGSCPILVYHKVDPRFEYGITRLTPRQFARHLGWLVARGYTTVHLADVLASVSAHRPLPPRSVVLAFDDGFESVYRHAYPLLREHGLTATVFVIAGYVGRENGWEVNLGGRRFRHLDWEQVQALREGGLEIGSHTLNHPDLTRLSPAQLRHELEASRVSIERMAGVTVEVLSCPFGRYSDEVARLAAAAGYRGMVVVRGCKGLQSVDGLIPLAGTCVYLTDGLASLRRKVEGRPLSWFGDLIERGIGWCAGRTPAVKGTPRYPESVEQSEG
ncbi:MAG: polysaccharide deacetylase family protein [Candidatus Latescibacteria bacterium]|nr:polysaccharide deacetylase family protein [Candidatus Latescibacterota bacterium]